MAAGQGQNSGALQRYGRFLATQAAEAGLGARALAGLFEAEARRQEARAAATGSPPRDPVSAMSCSRSTIDRLFNGEAFPRPPRSFTRQFLVFTSTAAGLPPAEHKRRWEQACALIAELSQDRADRSVQDHGPVVPVSGEETGEVARLRLQLDLERTQHTVSRLNFALRDTRRLVTTLWDIISALREIISGHHDQLRLAHQAGPFGRVAQLHEETERALAYKQAAQAEADQALARQRILEERWDKAHVLLHDLSQLPDATRTAGGGPAGAPPLPSAELLAQPALGDLDDIRSALEKVHGVNARADEEARALHTVLGEAHPLSPDDERLVLVAATRLSDPGSRRTALRTLVEHWPAHPDTRAALLRLASDPTPAVREETAAHLGACWWEEQAARETLALLAQDEHPSVREAAMRSVLVTDWHDDQAHAILLDLVLDSNPVTRLLAAGQLSARWPQTHAARDALLELLDAPGQDPTVRHRSVLVLLERWQHDPHTRDGLLRLIATHNTESAAVATAFAHILAQWLHDSLARTAVLSISPGSRFFKIITDRTIEQWRGHPGTRDALIRMAETDSAEVLHALNNWPAPTDGGNYSYSLIEAAERAAGFRTRAVELLGSGWAGDSVARDAVLRCVDDPDPEVRTRAGVALYFGWHEDAAARKALDALAQDPDPTVQNIITVELRYGEKDDTSPGSAD